MGGEWARVTLGEVIELKRGFDLPERERCHGQVPIISSSGLTGWHSEAPVKGPGVVTGRYGTIGQVFFVERDFWPLNTTLYVRDFKGNDARFVSYFLKLLSFDDYSDKGAVPGVNRNHLHMAPVIWPTRAEQEQIAELLGALDDKIELNRRMAETQEAMARALFKSRFVDFDPVRAKAGGRSTGLSKEVADLLPDSLDEDGLPEGWCHAALTRIRREVVGQMLDYAANAVVHWSVEELRARFGSLCRDQGRDADETLGELVGGWTREGSDADGYWAKVRTNLEVGRVRLVFVADRIPPELRRIVEFLNSQMQPAEVLAVELRQFEGQGLRTLVPLVLGQTQAASQRKASSTAASRRTWNEESFFAELAASTADEPTVVSTARELSAWMRAKADRVEFNDNPRWGSMSPVFDLGTVTLSGPFRIWTDGGLAIMFQNMLGRPVFVAPRCARSYVAV